MNFKELIKLSINLSIDANLICMVYVYKCDVVISVYVVVLVYE